MYSIYNSKAPLPMGPLRRGSVYCSSSNAAYILPQSQESNYRVMQEVMNNYSVLPSTMNHSAMTPISARSRCRVLSDDVFLPETPVQERVFRYDLEDHHGVSTRKLSLSPTSSLDLPHSLDSATDTSSLSGDDSSESSRSNVFELSPQKSQHFPYVDLSGALVHRNQGGCSSEFFSPCHDEVFSENYQPPPQTWASQRFVNANSGFNQSCHSGNQSYNSGPSRGRMITKANPENIENPDRRDGKRSSLVQPPFQGQSSKRQDFLRTLENERDLQRKKVLPKYTPKMQCKFCKNNGEDPEVYTKHRLLSGDVTLCPLLRHYVCRICGQTGDRAHTIRHCPWNTKMDTIAYQATFLA